MQVLGSMLLPFTLEVTYPGQTERTPIHVVALAVTKLQEFNVTSCNTKNHSLIRQGSPTPGPWTRMGPWPVRNRATQQEVSGG